MNASSHDFLGMQCFLQGHGVSHFLPTTVTAPVEFTLCALERMADAVEGWREGCGARPAGIHMEGPFLSHRKRGMHPAQDLQPPSIALFQRFQEAARGHIRLVTIAPEEDACPGAEPGAALDLIRYLEADGVQCSIGHTYATAGETMRAMEAGASSATHTFNAMRALDHRDPGVLGTVLDQQGLYADLICDGVHVAPECVRLWWRAKGPGRAILITDALSAAGMPDGAYRMGTSGVEVVGGRALVAEDLLVGTETLAGFAADAGPRGAEPDSVYGRERGGGGTGGFGDAVRDASPEGVAGGRRGHAGDAEPACARWIADGDVCARSAGLPVTTQWFEAKGA